MIVNIDDLLKATEGITYTRPPEEYSLEDPSVRHNEMYGRVKDIRSRACLEYRQKLIAEHTSPGTFESLMYALSREEEVLADEALSTNSLMELLRSLEQDRGRV